MAMQVLFCPLINHSNTTVCTCDIPDKGVSVAIGGEFLLKSFSTAKSLVEAFFTAASHSKQNIHIMLCIKLHT